MSKVCAICGTASERMYCTRKCANVAWRKSAKYLKYECKICGEPSSSPLCKLHRKAEKKVAKCKGCDEEFTPMYKTHTYCSTSCVNKKWKIDDDFFTHHKNIKQIYKILGFIFACGKVMPWGPNEIQIHSTKEKLKEFKKITSCTYPILSARSGKNLVEKDVNIWKIQMQNVKWATYLEELGLSNAYPKSSFPCILPEYRQWFLEGYIETPYRTKRKGNDLYIEIESIDLARGLKEITNGDLITENYGFTLILKDWIFKKA